MMTRTATRLAPIVLLMLLLAGPPSAEAAVVSVSWDNGDGWWCVPANWYPQLCPDNNETDQYEVTIDKPEAKVRLDEPPDGSWDVNSLVNHNELYLYDKTLTTTAGLTNHGTIHANGDTARIVGDVHNGSGAKIKVRAEGAYTKRRLCGSGEWTNHGEVLVDTDAWIGAEARLVADADLTFKGAGRLRLANPTLDPKKCYLVGQPGATIANDPGHTIEGNGMIQAALENAGIIDANASNRTLWLTGGEKTNTGTMVASRGTLRIEGGVLTNSGILRVADGAVVWLGTSVSGGSAEATSGGRFELHSGGKLENCTLTGAGVFEGHGGLLNNVTIGPGATVIGPSPKGRLGISGKLTNHGTLRAKSGADINVAGEISGGEPLQADRGGTFVICSGGLIEQVTLTGGGIFEGSDGALRDVEIAAGTTVRVAAEGAAHKTITFHGSGEWGNQGWVLVVTDSWIGAQAHLVADADLTFTGTGRLRLNNPTSVAKSYLRANQGVTITNDAGHTIDGHGHIQAVEENAAISNLGTIEANRGLDRTLYVTGNVAQCSGNVLTGGTWIARANSKLNVTTGSNITTNQGNVILDGLGSTFEKINTLADNQGGFGILSGRDFTTVGDLTNSGTLTVGVESTLGVQGELMMKEGSEYACQLGSPAGGLIAATGNVVLEHVQNGTTLSLRAGDRTETPGVNTWTILTADGPGGVEGSFTHAPAVDEYLYGGAFYRGLTYVGAPGTVTSVVVETLNYLAGDTDFDGDVDPADLAKLALYWDPAGTDKVWGEGNFDDYQDGNVDPADLALLAINWSPAGYLPEGTPPVRRSAAVPEPGTLGLLGAGLLGLLLWRRRRASGS